MDNTKKVKQILIQRYSKLNNKSEAKTQIMFDSSTIDDIIEKHNNQLILSVILVVIVLIGLIFQLVTLYLSKNIYFGLIANIVIFFIFQKGLHDQFEKKSILKTLKEIG